MEKLLSVKEAAEMLNISIHTVRAWLFQRRLPFVRLGRRIGLRSDDIDSFITKNYVEAQEKD